jgi:Cu/Ag efflux pump CusA
MEYAVLKRYNRELYTAVQGDVIDGVQPPDITAEVLPELAVIKARLPDGYRIDTGGSVEESAKANQALVLLFPVMIISTLALIMFQVRSFSAMFMRCGRWAFGPCWLSPPSRARIWAPPRQIRPFPFMPRSESAWPS